jgi:glycopeptide antibiotics resistance protein
MSRNIDIIAMFLIYSIFFYKKWKVKGNDSVIVNTLMYVYICLVLYVTLMPIIVSLPFITNHPYRTMNLLPFDDFVNGRGDTVRQIVLNVIMMMPFGFLLPIVKKKSLFSCTMATFLFSLTIEILQPLINGFRSSDITDVITNTIGGILGYLLYLLFRPLVNAILLRYRSNSAEKIYRED